MIEAVDPVHWRHLGDVDLPAARAEYRRTRKQGTGLGLTFAKHIAAKTGNKIDLLPVAHGGTSMQQWSPALKHLGSESLYGAMLRRTKLALETSPESVLRGVLWYQGESDCNPADALLYTERMKALISSWRADLDAPELPFYIVQLGVMAHPDNRTLMKNPSEWSAQQMAWTSIRDQQRLLPSVVPNTAVVPAIDLSIDDGIHIGTEALKVLGKRMADVALAKVYGVEAPSTIDILSVSVFDKTSLRVKLSGVNGGLRISRSAWANSWVWNGGQRRL